MSDDSSPCEELVATRGSSRDDINGGVLLAVPDELLLGTAAVVEEQDLSRVPGLVRDYRLVLELVLPWLKQVEL